MKLIILKILLITVLFSCSSIETENGLTYQDFETSLKIDMQYESIVAVFGEPNKDIGSGIHIYVYELKDSTEIWIGFAEYILYARHVDKDQNVLHTLF